MKEKLKMMTIVFSVVLVFMMQSVVYADNDGNDCSVGIATISNYKGTGSPCVNNLPGTANIAKGINNEFSSGRAKAWRVAFDFKNKGVHATDFMATTKGGNDHLFADNVDLMFYAGHGYLAGRNGCNSNSFVLTTKSPTYYAEMNEMFLGNRDLEWLVTFTCNFLKEDMSVIGKMAKGIHSICGYVTDMTITSDAGTIFSKACKQGVSVKEAYFRYGKNTQAMSNLNTVAVFTTKSCADDRIWGYGSQAADPVAYTKNKSGYVLYTYRCNW